MFEKIDFEFELTPTCYFKMLNVFKQEKISEIEWNFYCNMYLKDLMFLHQDVLKNLKEER